MTYKSNVYELSQKADCYRVFFSSIKKVDKFCALNGWNIEWLGDSAVLTKNKAYVGFVERHNVR